MRLEELTKTTKTLSLASVVADIPIDHLPNTKQERYHYANLLVLTWAQRNTVLRIGKVQHLIFAPKWR
jgi:hypothetical protein